MAVEGFVTELVIALDSDAPEHWKRRWVKYCEEWNLMDGGKRNLIVGEALKLCKMETNQLQPVLARWEGGLGDGVQKQIRFESSGWNHEKNKIVLHSSGGWSWEELTDLLRAFRRAFWKDFGKRTDCGELSCFFRLKPRWCDDEACA